MIPPPSPFEPLGDGPAPTEIPNRPITLDDLLARKAAALRASADAVGEAGWQQEDDVDWSRLVLRLRTAMELEEELLLEVVPDRGEPLIIDVSDRTFWWNRPLTDFPTRLRSLVIEPIDPRAFDAPSAGNDLEPLLWQLAHASFEGERARWLKPGERYKLRRWPNLTALEHDAEQVRAMSLLGQASLTAEEFASVAQLDQASADNLISALSLMGLLRVVPASDAVERRVLTAPPARTPGLFSKLRSLFGR